MKILHIPSESPAQAASRGKGPRSDRRRAGKARIEERGVLLDERSDRGIRVLSWRGYRGQGDKAVGRKRLVVFGTRRAPPVSDRDPHPALVEARRVEDV